MRNLTRSALASGALLLACTGQAQAATTIGSDLSAAPDLGFGCAGGCTLVQRELPGRPLTSPIDGVIVRWRIKAGSNSVAQPVKLRVVRGTGAAGTGAGTSAPIEVPATAPGTYTSSTRLPIRSGDFIGIDCCAEDVVFAVASTADASYVRWTPPLADGQTRTLNGGSAYEILVNADVEADADNDGFGDETQDQCPTDAGTQAACPPPPADTMPPETTFKGGPIKTDQPKARFQFESNEPGATFQCKLKGKDVKKKLKQYALCTSPKKYKKLDPGKYKFFVYAVDAPGNADLTPIKHKFTIVEEL